MPAKQLLPDRRLLREHIFRFFKADGVMSTLEPGEMRALLGTLRDERVQRIAIEDYGFAPLEKLIWLLEAKLPDEQNTDRL